MYYCYHDSPLGPLLIAGEDGALRLLHMDAAQPLALGESWIAASQQLDEVRRQLDQYFAGRRQRFELAVAPQGTLFQRQVWQALQQIPFGATCSYSELALRIGREKAVRAVGAANGANPIAVIIPCHRVIGRSGSLTGFAGGLPRKALLLRLEAGLGAQCELAL
jgi:methylated-DNA-[protein]-cysteine S-methyltransferase